MMFATKRRMFTWSPAPKRWDTGIAKPALAPITKPFTMKFTAPVDPTAAKA